MILITDLFLNDCKPIKSGINLIGADTVMSAQRVCVCGGGAYSMFHRRCL